MVPRVFEDNLSYILVQKCRFSPTVRTRRTEQKKKAYQVVRQAYEMRGFVNFKRVDNTDVEWVPSTASLKSMLCALKKSILPLFLMARHCLNITDSPAVKSLLRSMKAFE